MLARTFAVAYLAGVTLGLFPAAESLAGEANRARAEQFTRNGQDAMSRRAYSEARAALEEAIRADPTWDVPVFSRGTLFFHEGQFDRAIADYGQALGLATRPLPLHYFSRARAYLAKKEFDKASADFRRAVQMNPADYAVRGELMMALAYARKWRDASEEASFILKHNDADYAALVTRACARCKTDDLAGAMTDFDRAVRLQPDNVWAYIERAGAVQEFGNEYDAAIKDCDRILQSRRPGSRHESELFAGAYRIRAALHRKKGETELALADFSEALRLNPGHAAALLERGQIYGEEGDFKKAMADFSQYVRCYPNDPSGYEMRSLTHIALGDPGSAAADQRKAEILRKAGK